MKGGKRKGQGAARRALFIAKYVELGNATAAALAAGYSKRTAGQQGSRLTKNPEVAAEIAKRKGELLGSVNASQERIIEELARIAFFDPRKLFNEDDALKPIRELDDATAAVIAGFEAEEEYDERDIQEELEPGPRGGALKRRRKQRVAIGRLSKVKMVSKHAALESLMSYHGMHKSQKPGDAVAGLILTLRSHDGKPLR